MTPVESTSTLRSHGPSNAPALVYLPGIHGDWTLISSFRAAVQQSARFLEFTYPRTETWSLSDYANDVRAHVRTSGCERPWILAESFGSQVAWQWLADAANDDPTWRPQGLILAGGFVRYPLMANLRFAASIHRRASMRMLSGCLGFYRRYAWFRHRHAPETLASIDEFVARRTEQDRRAMCWRYELIRGSDFRETARATTLPVYALTGFFDPIVPWIFPWIGLKRDCPGFRAHRLIWKADHNVLGTAPQASARQVLEWMQVPH